MCYNGGGNKYIRPTVVYPGLSVQLLYLFFDVFNVTVLVSFNSIPKGMIIVTIDTNAKQKM